MNDRHFARGITAVCLLVVAGSASARPTYRVTDLGTLGGSESRAAAINSRGVVVGWSTVTAGGEARAFVHDGSLMTPLPNLPSGVLSFALGINDQGMIAGFADNGETLPFDPTTHAVRWVSGAVQDLGTTGGDRSWGYGINNAGHVVGWSQNQPIFANEFAFLYDGSMHDLGALPLGNNSEALGVNAMDQVVGFSTLPGGEGPKRATLWVNGHPINMSTLAGDRLDLNSWAYDINDHGVATGFSDIAPPGVAHHSFLYDVAVRELVDIGSADGFRDSEAVAINNRSEVVGTIFSEFARHAFVYSGGVMRDLNDLIPPTSGWELIDASDLNDAGQIVGTGERTGRTHAFRLDPCLADLNEDFIVDFADYLEFLNLFDAQDARADFNGDGIIDFGDYLEFLNRFDAGC